MRGRCVGVRAGTTAPRGDERVDPDRGLLLEAGAPALVHHLQLERLVLRPAAARSCGPSPDRTPRWSPLSSSSSSPPLSAHHRAPETGARPVAVALAVVVAVVVVPGPGPSLPPALAARRPRRIPPHDQRPGPGRLALRARGAVAALRPRGGSDGGGGAPLVGGVGGAVVGADDGGRRRRCGRRARRRRRLRRRRQRRFRLRGGGARVGLGAAAPPPVVGSTGESAAMASVARSRRTVTPSPRHLPRAPRRGRQGVGGERDRHRRRRRRRVGAERAPRAVLRRPGPVVAARVRRELGRLGFRRRRNLSHLSKMASARRARRRRAAVRADEGGQRGLGRRHAVAEVIVVRPLVLDRVGRRVAPRRGAPDAAWRALTRVGRSSPRSAAGAAASDRGAARPQDQAPEQRRVALSRRRRRCLFAAGRIFAL